jgi:hypothetical protein
MKKILKIDVFKIMHWNGMSGLAWGIFKLSYGMQTIFSVFFFFLINKID